jgi:hypothetical protein
MARTIPALLERVPMNDAADASADCGRSGHCSILGPVAGNLERPLAHYRAFARRNLIDRADFRWADMFGDVLDHPGLALNEFSERG